MGCRFKVQSHLTKRHSHSRGQTPSIVCRVSQVVSFHHLGLGLELLMSVFDHLGSPSRHDIIQLRLLFTFPHCTITGEYFFKQIP